MQSVPEGGERILERDCGHVPSRLGAYLLPPRSHLYLVRGYVVTTLPLSTPLQPLSLPLLTFTNRFTIGEALFRRAHISSGSEHPLEPGFSSPDFLHV